jgi:hypothetical protein
LSMISASDGSATSVAMVVRVFVSGSKRLTALL